MLPACHARTNKKDGVMREKCEILPPLLSEGEIMLIAEISAMLEKFATTFLALPKGTEGGDTSGPHLR